MHGFDPMTDATGTALAIRAREITATEALEAVLARVDSLNPAINAIIWQDRGAARSRAEWLDQEAANGRFHGPLHGVPTTVKEAFDWVGSPSTWGNPALADNMPGRNSLVVQRYLDAGAVIFGKTNVPRDLADWQTFNTLHGTTNNPWDIGRGPGGSSGGSAAALASGMSSLEAGSDIGSSIRNPAHYCGVFGHKPTWGVVPGQGHRPPGVLNDADIAVTGPMARSARDLQLAFGILAGADDLARPAWTTACPADPRERLAEFRIAIKLGDDECPVDQAYLDALHGFGETLERAGARVAIGTTPKIDSAAHFRLYLTLLGAALSMGQDEAMVLADIARAESKVSGRALDVIRTRFAGRNLRHADWLMHDNARHRARLAFDAFFDNWDILLTPVCASAAFEHDQKGERYERRLVINGREQPEILDLFWSGYSGVAGLPSVVGPIGLLGHLPIGYQAIAGYGRDHTALAFARAVEREIGGFTPPPGLEALA